MLSTAVPLLLLGFATSSRIEQYGLTEERYGLVLVVIAGTTFLLAGLLRRPLDIRIVPLTMAILAGVAAAGPIGARSMTVRSQIGRVQAALSAVPPDELTAKGAQAFSLNQRNDVMTAMEALDSRNALSALTDAPSWPAALPRTPAGWRPSVSR